MPFCMAVNPKFLLWGMTENLGKEEAFLELLWNQSMHSRCIFPAWVFVCQPCDLALSLVKYKWLDLQTQKKCQSISTQRRTCVSTLLLRSYSEEAGLPVGKSQSGQVKLIGCCTWPRSFHHARKGFLLSQVLVETLREYCWFGECPVGERVSHGTTSPEVRGRVSIGPTQSKGGSWLVSRMITGDVKETQGLMMLQKYSIAFQQGLFCLGELEKSRMPYNSPVEISLSCLLFSGVMYFSVILKMNGLYFSSFTMHHSVFPWSESLYVTF